MPILLINTPVQISNTKPDVYWDAAISPSSVRGILLLRLYIVHSIFCKTENCVIIYALELHHAVELPFFGGTQKH